MKKRNYWLKLKEDFYSQPYIKKLRKIAGGDTYTIIYQKILLLSIKTNGYVVFQGIEKTFEEELSLILDEDVDNIKVAISFMKANKLIESTKNDNEYLLPDMLSLIGSESESANRVRAYRERKSLKILTTNNKTLHCNATVTECNENVTTDIDIDIDKDIESSSMTTPSETKTVTETDDDDIFEKFKEFPAAKVRAALIKLREIEKTKTIGNRTAYLRVMLKQGFDDVIPATAVKVKEGNHDTAPHRDGYLATIDIDRNKDRLDRQAEELILLMPADEKSRRINKIIKNKNLAKFGSEIAQNMAEKYLAAEIINGIREKSSQKNVAIKINTKEQAKNAVNSGNFTTEDWLKSFGVDPDSEEHKENMRRNQLEQENWNKRKKELGIT
jgi:predicted phage replisome organizer